MPKAVLTSLGRIQERGSGRRRREPGRGNVTPGRRSRRRWSPARSGGRPSLPYREWRCSPLGEAPPTRAWCPREPANQMPIGVPFSLKSTNRSQTRHQNPREKLHIYLGINSQLSFRLFIFLFRIMACN